MTAVAMLAAVRAIGGDVRLLGSGRLKVVAPTRLPDELVEQLRAIKPELISLLTPPSLTSQPAEALTDRGQERNAIGEIGGGASREWAEALAQLDPDKPPGDVPKARLLRFIDDCGRFLGDGWARQAAAFGWEPLDLFGCDRERPFARIDRAGLLWLLNGRKLVALTADTATIETPVGAHQTYRRGSIAHSEVTLAWELGPIEGGREKCDESPLSRACAYCGQGQLLGHPLLDAAVNGDMFRAHRTCLDLEWQSWQREPRKAIRELLRDGISE
jgi:hypothetical protein